MLQLTDGSKTLGRKRYLATPLSPPICELQPRERVRVSPDYQLRVHFTTALLPWKCLLPRSPEVYAVAPHLPQNLLLATEHRQKHGHESLCGCSFMCENSHKAFQPGTLIYELHSILFSSTMNGWPLDDPPEVNMVSGGGSCQQTSYSNRGCQSWSGDECLLCYCNILWK